MVWGFTLDEVENLRGVGLADELEGEGRERFGQALEDFLGLVGAQGLGQDCPGVLHTTRGDVLVRLDHVIELFEQVLGQVGLDLAQVGDFQGKLLDVFRAADVLEDVGRDVGSQRDEQRRGFLPAV